MNPVHHGSATFADLWNPGVIVLTGFAALLYFMCLGPMKERFIAAAPVPVGKKLYFITGLVVFYIGQGSPLDYYGHHFFFSVHMFQQSLLYLVVPPLIYLGTPDWMLKPLLDRGVFSRAIRIAVKPVIAVFTFNILFSVYHFPIVLNTLMEIGWLHLLYHLMLFLSAFQMWFPVFSPVEEAGSLSDLQKMAYVFGNGILLTPACALIIFANELLYTNYINVTPPFELIPILDDQQLGGVIMKIIQEIVYGTCLAYIFFKWYRKERVKENPYPDGYLSANRTEEQNRPAGLNQAKTI